MGTHQIMRIDPEAGGHLLKPSQRHVFLAREKREQMGSADSREVRQHRQGLPFLLRGCPNALSNSGAEVLFLHPKLITPNLL